MFYKCLLCIILFAKQTFPLPGNALSPVTVSNHNFINDSDSITSYTKYDDWKPRIVNGVPARLGEVPYQIALKSIIKRSKSLYKTFCGGAIIAPRKLLSAAHCFEEKATSNCHLILRPGQVSSKTLKETYAVAGTLKNIAQFKSDGQWRELENVQYPKSYEFPKDDIAVIVTINRFEYNKHISPIPMASQDKDYEGKCLVSGYGRVGTGKDSAHSPVLQLANLMVLTRKLCNLKTGKSRDKHICTASWITDVGIGDSGGPLVCAKTGDPNEDKSKGLLVGILSGTIVDQISLFTRVTSYRSFIDSVNSVSRLMHRYNTQSCSAIIIFLIYKTFVLL